MAAQGIAFMLFVVAMINFLTPLFPELFSLPTPEIPLEDVTNVEPTSFSGVGFWVFLGLSFITMIVTTIIDRFRPAPKHPTKGFRGIWLWIIFPIIGPITFGISMMVQGKPELIAVGIVFAIFGTLILVATTLPFIIMNNVIKTFIDQKGFQLFGDILKKSYASKKK